MGRNNSGQTRRLSAEPVSLKVNTCRYPLWGKEKPTHEYCGEPVKPGSSYCEHRHRVCHRTSEPNVTGVIGMSVQRRPPGSHNKISNRFDGKKDQIIQLYLEGRDNKEIAGKLNVTAARVRATLSRYRRGVKD